MLFSLVSVTLLIFPDLFLDRILCVQDPELASRRALYSSAETRTLDAGHFDVGVEGLRLSIRSSMRGISCVWDVSLKIQQLLAGEKRSERDVRAERNAELCPVQCPRCPQCRCSRPELCSRFALRAFLVPVNMTGRAGGDPSESIANDSAIRDRSVLRC